MTHCIVIDVDGEPVRFQLAVPESELTQEDRDAMVELVRLVRSRVPQKKGEAKPISQIDIRKRRIRIVRKK